MHRQQTTQLYGNASTQVPDDYQSQLPTTWQWHHIKGITATKKCMLPKSKQNWSNLKMKNLQIKLKPLTIFRSRATDVVLDRQTER